MPLSDIQKPDRPANEAGRSEPADQNAENPEYFEGGVDPEPSMGPEQPSPPGGPAIKPQSSSTQPTNALKGVAEKGAQTAIRRGLDVATEGATQLPVLRNIADWASKNLAREAIKKWAYGLAAGVWGTIGPYATVIIIVIILLFVIAGPAFARIGKARRGADGNEAPTPASVYSGTDMADIAKVLGNSNIVPGDPTSWYFNQGDEKWGTKAGQAPGWSVNEYRSRGCAITSAAMMVKYHGGADVDPYIFGGYVADRTGSIALSDTALMTSYLKKYGIEKKVVPVAKDLETVKKYIAAGHPILAQGHAAFRASQQHWVVIIGISKDDKNLVLNDPSADPSRGRPARYSPAYELTNGRITSLYAITD